MMSLDNVFSIDEFNEWAARVQQLEAALQPFAALATLHKREVDPDHHTDDEVLVVQVTLGAIRRAKEAL